MDISLLSEMLRDLAILKRPKKGKCRIKENGKSCRNDLAWRGICQLHYQRINKQGKLDKFALPCQRQIYNEYHFELAKRPKEGVCRIKEKGRLCKAKTHCRGLCKQHFDILRRNKAVDKYGLSSTLIKNYKFNPDHQENYCRISDNGEACPKKVYGRGLCQQHYNFYKRRKLLELFGTPSKRGYYDGKYREE